MLLQAKRARGKESSSEDYEAGQWYNKLVNGKLDSQLQVDEHRLTIIEFSPGILPKLAGILLSRLGRGGAFGVCEGIYSL